MKPLVGIVPNLGKNRFDKPCSSVATTYTEAIEKAGGAPFILPLTEDSDVVCTLLGKAYGILFIGGNDIAPKCYGENPIKGLIDVTPFLDSVQLLFFEKAFTKNMPMLGICRGAQLINVGLGGTLIQDIPSQITTCSTMHITKKLIPASSHKIHCSSGSALHKIFGDCTTVNSIHHQAVKTPGKGLKATAKDACGIIEGAEHETYPITLVQWHPELMLAEDDAMLPLFMHFIKQCTAYANAS